jgi:tRNA(Ile)-lysidine synthase
VEDWAGFLARCAFPSSGRVDCAVSGGPDSIALLVLARAAQLDVTAWHVDHGLRPDSAADAVVVEQACHLVGASFRSVSVSVAPGPNLEARARAARYAALPADVATGHTADDQAETVLLALMRGAGIDGLAAMRPGPRRPILALRRSDTNEICRTMGITPVIDPTNSDLALRRNRIRHELLPLANEIAARDLVPLLARSARVLRADADLLDSLSTALDPTDVAALRGAPPPLAYRALRRWLATAAGGYPPDSAAIARVMEVVHDRARACEVTGVGRVARTAGRLRIEAASATDADR